MINKQLPSDDLLVHVIEQFPPSVLINDAPVSCVEGVHEVPMPMVQIQSNIFTEVSYTLLWLRIRCCIVLRYNNWQLKD